MIGFQHEIAHVADRRGNPTPLDRELAALRGRGAKVVDFWRAGDGWDIKIMAGGSPAASGPPAEDSKPVTGDAAALGRLFSAVEYLPHGVRMQPSVKERRAARKARKQNWQRRRQRVKAEARLARFGLDERLPDGNPNRDPGTVRAMRRARKQERSQRRPPPARPVYFAGQPHLCAKFKRMRSLGKRTRHARACTTCRHYFAALAYARAGKAPQ